jgi:hypothetical protein
VVLVYIGACVSVVVRAVVRVYNGAWDILVVMVLWYCYIVGSVVAYDLGRCGTDM